MLKSISIENFFSFGASQTITLDAGANLLVGINGSGKSNFFRAMRLLQAALDYSSIKDVIDKEFGGISNIFFLGKEDIKSFKITYTFDGKKSPLVKSDLKKTIEVGANIPYSFSSNKEVIDTINELQKNDWEYQITVKTNHTGTISAEKEISIETGHQKYTSTYNGAWSAPITTKQFPVYGFSKRDYDIHLPVFERCIVQCFTIPIERLFLYSYFDTSPSKLGIRFANNKEGIILSQSGNNLKYALNYLYHDQQESYENLLAAVRNVNQNFEKLIFKTLHEDVTLSLQEKKLHDRISLNAMSDGTVRFLSLMTIFYNPERGKLICIDEPELGLHPDMIKALANAIKHAVSDGTQFIIATHHPLLLNYFDIENVTVFEKDADNQTILTQLTTADLEKMGEETDYVGQLWLNGIIGGVRW